MAAARIVDSGTPFVENGEGQDGRRVPIELSRPLAHPAKLAHQIPLEVDHRDLRRLGIEYVKVARAIEGYGGYPAEGVPIAALQGTYPVQLLEVGLEEAVLRGQFDHLLSGQGENGDG